MADGPGSARRPEPDGPLRPWQESRRGADGLQPREEIPVRLSVRDRARIPLPGSWRVTVTSLFPYSGTTTLTGVIGLTL
ncbi:hypothetical protein, partial [Frankia sp. AvcI1]